MRITKFIYDEVTRQGFIPDTAEHRQRCAWMKNAWVYAQINSLSITIPTVQCIKELGMLVEPQENSNGFRRTEVKVGNHFPPRAENLPRLMDALCGAAELYTPDEFYKEFQEIHPFVDGNGRVGKIIHNWMNKSLLNPVLVKDFFGKGVP